MKVMNMTIKDQIVKLMSRKSGVTLGECVARGFNANTSRRILGHEHGKQISRKCRASGEYACAYVIEE